MKLTNVLTLGLELFYKIAKDQTGLAREFALRFADFLLDFAEEAAAKTQTTLDDRYLAWLRAALQIPEFEDAAPTENKTAPAPLAPPSSGSRLDEAEDRKPGAV